MADSERWDTGLVSLERWDISFDTWAPQTAKGGTQAPQRWCALTGLPTGFRRDGWPQRQVEGGVVCRGSRLRDVRHRQYYVEFLRASERELPLIGGDLMVVAYPENPSLDWELVVRTVESLTIESAPYDLVITGPEGTFTGAAILVRSDGRSHVFRGAGALGGFADEDFT